jgi:putative membrane protein
MISNKTEHRIHISLLIIGLIVFGWSYIDHKLTFGWILLSVPIITVVSLFIFTYKKFTFTTLVYIIGFLYACLLMVGAKYTYTYVPLFDSISESMGWTRNYYDRVAHFAQGFVPFLIFKEYLLRKKILSKSNITNLVIIALVLGFSASWELLEYVTAELSGMSQSFILDMQGDIWDTQLDMLSALLGAMASWLILGKYHMKLIERKMMDSTSKKTG